MPGTVQMASKSEAAPPLLSGSLVDFLNTLPSPLIATLVGLAPYISQVRHDLQVLSWKTTWEESWLVVALWWAACIFPEVGLRYILPLGFLCSVVIAQWTERPPIPPPPISEDALQKTILDLTIISGFLPLFSPLPSPPPLPVLLRVSLIGYVTYLLLTFVLSLRLLIAISGTVLLTWRARWASVARRALWRSALLRRLVYRAWAILSGQPLPQTLSPQSQAALEALSVKTQGALPPSASEIRFLFTVYENQRWWMGLDWTAALLPNERPSWCSASFQPVSPPMAFPLPTPTTVYMPSPASPSGRVKRTARWRWVEEEWRVVVRKEQGAGSSRVVKPLPSLKDDESSAARILRAVRRESTLGGGGSPERSRNDDHPEKGHTPSGSLNGSSAGPPPATSTGSNPNGNGEEEEPLTDADGWVYGDNKWEYASGKGGMGKYTRYRRWTRIAVLTETVEPAEPGEMGIQQDYESEGMSESPTQETAPETQDAHAAGDARSKMEGHDSDSHEEGGAERSGLRQRLKAVVKSATHA